MPIAVRSAGGIVPGRSGHRPQAQPRPADAKSVRRRTAVAGPAGRGHRPDQGDGLQPGHRTDRPRPGDRRHHRPQRPGPARPDRRARPERWCGSSGSNCRSTTSPAWCSICAAGCWPAAGSAGRWPSSDRPGRWVWSPTSRGTCCSDAGCTRVDQVQSLHLAVPGPDRRRRRHAVLRAEPALAGRRHRAHPDGPAAVDRRPDRRRQRRQHGRDGALRGRRGLRHQQPAVPGRRGRCRRRHDRRRPDRQGRRRFRRRGRPHDGRPTGPAVRLRPPRLLGDRGRARRPAEHARRTRGPAAGRAGRPRRATGRR